MALDVKCKIRKEVFVNYLDEFRILGCKPIGNYNMELDKWGGFSISGSNLFGFKEGDEVELTIRPNQNAKRPASYILVGYPGLKMEKEEIIVEEEKEVSILSTMMEYVQAERVHEAYPHFVQMVLRGEEDEIDYHNIFNVGKVRIESYIDKIKKNLESILFFPVCAEMGITQDKEVQKLSEQYKSPEILQQEFEENPYRIYHDVIHWSFGKSDREVLKRYPDLKSSKLRCEYGCINILRDNELEGDTRINAEVLGYMAEELIPECKDYIPEVVNGCQYIHYDEATGYSAMVDTYEAEETIAKHIKDRLLQPNIFETAYTMVKPDFEQFREVDGFKCTDEQMQILDNVWEQNVSVLTGGAGCVDCDTEFFTGTGWKRIAEYQQGDKVLQYNKDGTAELVDPLAYIKKPCDKLWHFETPHNINQTVCEEHRILYKWKGYDAIQETNVLELKKKSDNNVNWGAGFITQFYHYGNGMNLSDERIRVMVAVMAEGHFNTQYVNSKSTWCIVRLKKVRKINRLKMLLEKAKIEYTEKVDKFGVTIIRFYAPERRKVYGGNWWKVNKSQARIICEEVTNWDGTIVKSRVNNLEKPCFRTTEKQSADYMQYIFTINGWQSTISNNSNAPSKKPEAKIVYRVSTKLNKLSSLCFDTRATKTKTQFIQVPTTDGYKYCFTVPSHMLVLRRKDCIFITGNCGKTSSMKALIRMLENYGISYLLLAPTGIAAKRLAESTGRSTSTIHRFLAQGADIDCLHFRGIVLCEESSMISVHLMSALLKKVGYSCKLVFVCDPAQLASIQCGNFITDVINSGIVPNAHLTKVFRYGIGGISTIATDIRHGTVQHLHDTFDDFEYTPISSTPIKQIMEQYQKMLDKGYTKNDIMVLSPFNKGDAGTIKINNAIQSHFNDSEYTPVEYERNNVRIHFKWNDKVINTHNSYRMSAMELSDDGTFQHSPVPIPVMNGDIGYVREVVQEEKGYGLIIEFDNGYALYEGSDLSNLMLGYALSCHRVQGSQAKAVIVLADETHKRILSRNILYVATSRAQKDLVLIVDVDVLRDALEVQEENERDTWLYDMLKEEQ